MDLSDSAFFAAYVRALNSRQLDALTGWQDSRLSDDPNKEVIADALTKKRTLYLEKKRREELVDD